MRTVTVGVLLCSIALTAPAAQENRPSPALRFEEGPCPFTADGVVEQLRCGSVSVLEDRSAPEGRRFRLAVAIVKSLSQSPRPDPIVWLAGGPGGRLVGRAPAIVKSGVLDGWRADRDVILYDQRGASLSEPRLCPEETANWQGQPGREDSLTFRARRREVAARCRASVARAGFNLSHYNSAVSALDLQDLRRALGYKQWNLYGPSYGARLALVAMRDAPEGIRSAIVAAPIPPPNVAWWASRPFSVFDVVHRLSTACAAQPACDAAFPDVEQTFWRNLEAFDREPWTLQLELPNGNRQTLKVTGTTAASLAMNGLPIRAGLITFPMRVHALRARDETLVNALFTSTRPTQEADDDAASQAMHHAVQCFEEAPLSTPALFENARRSYPSVLVDGGLFADPGLCEHLHPFRASPAQLAEVRSDIPTLIVTGEFDFLGHRSYGPMIQRSLPNSQLAEIRGATHNGGGHRDYECTRRMTRDFLNAPTQKLDMSCLQAIPSLEFVTDVKAIPR